MLLQSIEDKEFAAHIKGLHRELSKVSEQLERQNELIEKLLETLNDKHKLH